MATKQNGVLATFTPTVTPYTHSSQTATSLAITTQGWPMYTCPGATMVSGKLIIANILDGKSIDLIKIDGNKISRPYILNRNLYVITNNSIVKIN